MNGKIIYKLCFSVFTYRCLYDNNRKDTKTTSHTSILFEYSRYTLFLSSEIDLQRHHWKVRTNS